MVIQEQKTLIFINIFNFDFDFELDKALQPLVPDAQEAKVAAGSTPSNRRRVLNESVKVVIIFWYVFFMSKPITYLTLIKINVV